MQKWHSIKLSPFSTTKTISFLLFSFCLSAVSSLKCDYSEGLLGIGATFDLVDTKINIVGFEASVSYVSLPADETPFVKILAASEEPDVFSEDGILTISAGTCGAGLVVEEQSSGDEETAISRNDPEGTTKESPVASGAFSSRTSTSTAMTISGLMASFFAPRPYSRVSAGVVVMATLLGSLTTVQGQATACKPSLELEISLPVGAEVASTFGDTDHYLAATLDTVVWGYYDPEATPKVTMESGETVTVEVITHHSGHDYAKMIRGDPAVEEIFYWASNTTELEKPEPKLPGTGVHLITGPIEVVGAEPGDVIQVDILELDPRNNPSTGKCYGTNSQKFAGYHYRPGEKRDGTPYTRAGGTEAITVFEFVETETGKMKYGKPVYMYRFPNMTAPDGSQRTFDNNPSVMIPHEYNYGYNGELLEEEPIEYPEGFDGTTVTDPGGIVYLNPDPAKLEWKVPLRPHLGTLAVMPNNTANYIDDAASGGANSIPPSRFGGNVDDWRIGKGGTMFYTVEVPGGMVVVGDTHAAQGDAELAGTAMETSMTTKLRITLHKQSELPAKVQNLNFPLLETSDQYVIHGFAYDNYLDQLEDPSDVFAEGATLDKAMEDCFLKTRNWLMDTFELTEEETIAMMTTAVDFGITQVVDGNWGVHADVDKFVFSDDDTDYDYSCTTSKSGRRNRKLSVHTEESRRLIMQKHGLVSTPQEYAEELYARVTKSCASCATHVARQRVADQLLDAKLHYAKKMMDFHDNLRI